MPATSGGPWAGAPTWSGPDPPPPLTPQALPPSGIHIFASQLHTHLTGRKVVTVLARDGQERQVVNRDDHYSPHFQVGTARPTRACFAFPRARPTPDGVHRGQPLPLGDLS